MDESWRMRMGLNNLPRRRSTEETSSDRMMMMMRRNSAFGINCNSDNSETTLLDPENFNDVFGGPPRSIVSRQFSGDLIFTAGNRSNNNNNNTTFYEEIFRSSEFVAQAKNTNNNGRKLPGFRIPPRISGGGGRGGCGGGGGGVSRRSEGFYDDIFGSDNEDRRSESRSKLNYSKSKSKSKSNSSSVLSSEDLSPLRPSIAEDVFFTSVSSKLREINVPGRRNSSSTMRADEQQRRGVTSSDFPWINHESSDHLMNNENNYRMSSSSSRFGFSHSISSPETFSIEPNSYRSCIKIQSVDDCLDINPDHSPSNSSSVVSLHRDLADDDELYQTKTYNQDKILQEEEVMSSSYVIEINNKGRIAGEAAGGIEEAIAWAKEKFQSQCLEIFEAGANHHHQQQTMRLSRSPTEPIPTTQRQG